MTTPIRYKYRLRPSTKARSAMSRDWDRCRWVWNQCVARADEQRAEGDQVNSGYDMCAELTDWRGRKPWLAAGSQNVQANMILNWSKNRKAAFNVPGRRHPKFKSRHRTRPSMTYTTNGFKISDERLVLAGGIHVPVVWHRELPSKPTSVTVYRDAVGHWWASFVVRVEHEPLPETGRSIGIDWGLKQVATTTSPTHDLPHSRHGRKLARELAHAQRRMARRRRKKGQPPSNGYQRARHETARLHQKVQNQRRHEARQWARRVAADHDTIAVENLNTAFMVANRRLANATADARIGDARAMLNEYAARYGRCVIPVNPAGTTMTCGQCGVTRTKRLALSERTFRCTCGHVADRDRNAADVILQRAEMNPCGADGVRHQVAGDSMQPEPRSTPL